MTPIIRQIAPCLSGQGLTVGEKGGQDGDPHDDPFCRLESQSLADLSRATVKRIPKPWWTIVSESQPERSSEGYAMDRASLVWDDGAYTLHVTYQPPNQQVKTRKIEIPWPIGVKPTRVKPKVILPAWVAKYVTEYLRGTWKFT